MVLTVGWMAVSLWDYEFASGLFGAPASTAGGEADGGLQRLQARDNW